MAKRTPYIPADILAAREAAECLYDAQAVARAVDQLAVRLAVRLDAAHPIVMCVMNGGVILTAELLLRLHFPLEVSYVHATRYRDATRGASLEWRALPSIDVAGRTVLLVDDVLDEGHTLAAVVEKLRELAGSDDRHRCARRQGHRPAATGASRRGGAALSRSVSVRARHGLSRALAQSRGNLCVAGGVVGVMTDIGDRNHRRHGAQSPRERDASRGSYRHAVWSGVRNAADRQDRRKDRDLPRAPRTTPSHRAAPDQLSRQRVAAARTRRDRAAREQRGGLDRGCDGAGRRADSASDHRLHVGPATHLYGQSAAAARGLQHAVRRDTARSFARGGARARTRTARCSTQACTDARRARGWKAPRRSIEWRATAATSSA